MKNLKTLNRKELKNVLGGATLACEAPVDGGCSKPGITGCLKYVAACFIFDNIVIQSHYPECVIFHF